MIYNADDNQSVATLRNGVGRRIGFGMSEGADYRATDVRCEQSGQSFALSCRGEYLGRITLRVQGRHNVYNALAAAAVAREHGICMHAIAEGLANFVGVHRRMEYKGMLDGAVVYDDYAHHPTEIRAAMDAARSRGEGKLICVFQSHTYSRTAALFDAFAEALQHADAVIVAPIYAAREQNVYGVSEASLAQAIRQKGTPADYGTSFSDTADKLKACMQAGDTVLVMGAGDIEKLYPYLFS